MSKGPSPPPLLDAFLAHWAEKLTDEAPAILGREFPDGYLQAWTGRLALIERMSDSRFRFVMVGTKLIPRFSANLTGAVFDDISPDVLGDLQDRVKQAFAKGNPVVATVLVPQCHCHYIDLLFPLSGEEGMGELVLMASCPDQAHLYHSQ